MRLKWHERYVFFMLLSSCPTLWTPWSVWKNGRLSLKSGTTMGPNILNRPSSQKTNSSLRKWVKYTTSTRWTREFLLCLTSKWNPATAIILLRWRIEWSSSIDCWPCFILAPSSGPGLLLKGPRPPSEHSMTNMLT